jgi:16S rRNA (cytosine967-C5)-methyltransferase
MALLADTFQRLGRSARCVQADLSAALPDEAPWARRQQYDRILLDAPCTATGVLRRHPDIRLLRRPSDAAAFAAVQQRMLQHCFELLKIGGRLLYVTCSILKAENEAVIEAFLAQRPEAVLVPLGEAGPWPSTARMLRCGISLLPGSEADSDGFYYAALTKVAKAQHS